MRRVQYAVRHRSRDVAGEVDMCLTLPCMDVAVAISLSTSAGNER